MTKKQPISDHQTISIVLPVYNEEQRIAEGIREALRLRELWPAAVEIIVVDDGSTDRTLSILQELEVMELIVLSEQHKGKGATVKKGVLSASNALIVFSDIDWSVPVEQVIQMLNISAQIVIASRELSGSRRIAEPPWRHLMGKVFNRWVQWMLLSGYYDTQCGCKIFQKEVAHQIFAQVQEKGWAFDVEILVLAHLFGVKVVEFPVSWQYQANSKIRFVADGIAMGRAVLRIKNRLLQNEYQR